MEKIIQIFFTLRNRSFTQFLIYGFVAVIATIIDFAIVYTLTEFSHIYYLYSIVVGYFIASIVNYFLQKKITFNNLNTRYIRQFSVFFIIGLGGACINILITFICVEYLLIWYIHGKAIATLIAFIWNFNANKFFTFKKA